MARSATQQRTSGGRKTSSSSRPYTTRISTEQNSFTLSVDGNLFAAGFAIGLILGKLILRNTVLAAAFGMGLGLAVSTTAEVDDRREQA